MTPIVHITYDDSTAPTDSNTIVLFDSTVAWPAKRQHQYAGIRRFNWHIRRSHNGTVRLRKSDDRGANWSTVSDTGDAEGSFEVHRYDDFQVQWVNGGTTQTTWDVDINLTEKDA